MTEFLKKLEQKTLSIKIETSRFTSIVPAQLYTFDLKYEIDSGNIIENILNYRKKFPKSMHEYDSSNTNVKGWHSDYHTHRMTKFLNKLIKVQKEKLKNIMNLYDFYLDEIWFNIYTKGDYANRHIHHIYGFSTVYFPFVEKNPTPLVFDNNSNNDRNELTIIPKTNMLICFPGFLYHQVPKVTENIRYSVAANFSLKRIKYVRDPIFFQNNISN